MAIPLLPAALVLMIQCMPSLLILIDKARIWCNHTTLWSQFFNFKSAIINWMTIKAKHALILMKPGKMCTSLYNSIIILNCTSNRDKPQLYRAHTPCVPLCCWRPVPTHTYQASHVHEQWKAHAYAYSGHGRWVWGAKCANKSTLFVTLVGCTTRF